MTQTNLFEEVVLDNRLGQAVILGVKLLAMESRDYLFLNAPKSAPSSLIAKNAEHFAHQLVNRFELEPKTVDFIEIREQADAPELLRWRFEWVGHSAHAARSQVVTKASQQEFLSSVLTQGIELPVAGERTVAKRVQRSERVADVA